MLRLWALTVVGLALLAGCGADDPDRSPPTLEGAWSLIGYADHGVVATASGTATFGSDGSFAILGEITFPDEPMDSLTVSGTWSMQGDRATLTTPDGSGEWVVSFSGTEATLSLVGPDPTNTIHLRRRTPRRSSARSNRPLRPTSAARSGRGSAGHRCLRGTRS
jgi:hypothetical protein